MNNNIFGQGPIRLQQRPAMSRDDLRDALDELLTRDIPGGPDGPKLSVLRKAASTADQIMLLVDEYLRSR